MDWEVPFCLFFGFLVGIVASVLGIGGGVMLVPFIVLGLGGGVHKAVGTSVLAIPFGAVAATVRYAKARFIDWKTATLLSLFSIPGAFVGWYVCGRVREVWLVVSFAVVLGLVGVRMVVAREGRRVGWFSRVWFAGAFGAGVTAGLFGIGGGALNVPIIHSLGKTMKVSVATSAVVIMATCASVGLMHLLRGNADWCRGLSLGVGLAAGATLGASVLPKLRTLFLRLLFAGVLFFVAVRMVVRAL